MGIATKHVFEELKNAEEKTEKMASTTFKDVLKIIINLFRIAFKLLVQIRENTVKIMKDREIKLDESNREATSEKTTGE